MKKCAHRFSNREGTDVPVTIPNAAGDAKPGRLDGVAADDGIICMAAVDVQTSCPHVCNSPFDARTVYGGSARPRPWWPGFRRDVRRDAREGSHAGRRPTDRSVNTGAGPHHGDDAGGRWL